MKFVITGASGHIGNNLVRAINRDYPDFEVVVLTRRMVDKELAGTNCRQAIGDLFSQAFLSENIDSDSIVVHCAGFIDLTDKMIEETYRINLQMTQIILDVCLEIKVKKFIYIGSTDAIAKEDSVVICEPSDYYPNRIEGNYGKSKAETSHIVLDAINTNPDFNGAIVIPSAVIGINDYKPSAVGKIIDGIIRGNPEIGIKGGYNFVDVEDVCRVILLLSFNDKRGQYIVAGESIGVKDFFVKINTYLGIKRTVFILPTFLVKLFLPFISSLNKITLKALNETHDFSCERLQKELGFIPTPIDETVGNTIEWFKKYIKFK